MSLKLTKTRFRHWMKETISSSNLVCVDYIILSTRVRLFWEKIKRSRSWKRDVRTDDRKVNRMQLRVISAWMRGLDERSLDERKKTFEKLVTSLLSSFILSLKVFDISSALLIALTFNSKMKLQEDEFCFRFQKGKQVQPTTRMLFFLDTKKWWSSNDDVMTRALLIFIYGDSERKPNTYYRSCRRKRVPSSCCKLHDSCSFNQQVQPGKTDHQQQKINNENRPGMQRKTSFLKRDQSNIRNDCVQSCLGHEKSWGRNHHNDHHEWKRKGKHWTRLQQCSRE